MKHVLYFSVMLALVVVTAQLPPLIQQELDRCGAPLDAHLRIEGTWFTNAAPVLAEMTSVGVAQGILMGFYGPTEPVVAVDSNVDIAEFINQAEGRLFGLASLNTTGNWTETRDAELARLSMYLEQDGFVGAKITPPHTRLAMNSSILEEIVRVIANSSSSHPAVLGIHVGTTPFCGAFGDFILGERGLCTEPFVDPYVLEPLIAAYQNVRFILMHGGQDFAQPGNGEGIPFYNGTNFDHTIAILKRYTNNTVLEISAMLAVDDNTNEYSNPLAFENLQKIVAAGLQHRTLYGSDSNQFSGGMLPYLNSTIHSMIQAGFTQEERCNVLVDNPKKYYNIPLDETNNPTTTPSTTLPPPLIMVPPSIAPTSSSMEPTPASTAPNVPTTVLASTLLVATTVLAMGRN